MRGQRLQRSRRKGYRTPEGVIYVGRPTLWGNPFTARRFGHARSVKLHLQWLDGDLGALSLERLGFDPAEIDALFRLRARVLAALPRLVDRALQCWCPLTTALCHAETLLGYAELYSEYDRIAA